MRDNQAGFSLVELVVGIALMVLIMSGVAGMLTNLLGHGVRGIDLIDRQQEARWAVNMIAEDIRYATAFKTLSNTEVELVKTDSTGTSVTINYKLVENGSNYVLTRINTSGTTSVASPLGNADRGYVGSGDFAINATTSGTTVNQVNIVYKIRRNSTDTTPAVAQTTIYPINGLTAP
ncbi:MAG: hypothetical protein H6Q74_2599 [Firmicutes bacterium]|nr:hypothetical protein [Bacillota bacterium]